MVFKSSSCLISASTSRPSFLGRPRSNRIRSGRGARLNSIPGSVRDVLPWPDGCAFAPRCHRRVDECVGAPPELVIDYAGHGFRCVNFEPVVAEVRP